MKLKYGFLLVGFAFLASGCVVRTYPLTRDRIDQDLAAGNRGYLQGTAPAPEQRAGTRRTQVVEVELYPPIRFDTKPRKNLPKVTTSEFTEGKSLEGNRGYITQSINPPISEADAALQKYTVGKHDTLQKISKKFYGTTKKWKTIYDANKDVLRGPDKVYPGQVLNIPVMPAEKLKETRENLK